MIRKNHWIEEEHSMQLRNLIIVFSFISYTVAAHFVDITSTAVKLLSLEKMRFCYISFVKVDGKDFLVKQKHKERKLLGCIRDALTAHVAETFSIAHKVSILSAGMKFPGKVEKAWPATIHTIAPGRVVKKNDTPYRRMNIKQAEEGFRRDMLPWMAKHDALAQIIAIDVFLNNHDRHRGNVFFNEMKNSFCAIDMDSAFKYNLCKLACKNFRRMLANGSLFPLSAKEVRALRIFRDTIALLIDQYSPDYMVEKYDEFARQAGFVPGSPLYVPRVAEEMEHNRKIIRQSHKDAKELVKIVNSILKRVVK